MLDPDNRHMYVEALRPPLGYRLAEAIATTYSLDLTTLLGVPIALVLPHLDARRLGKESAVAVLDALRQASKRVTVFCERGLIDAPSTPHVLYGMLEDVIVEVAAPAGGCLHAKAWLMRFEPEPGAEGEPSMRVIVLSRNLTTDRCWDVSLVLDGRITGRKRAANGPLGELFDALPKHAVRPLSDRAAKRVDRMAADARRTEWELPDGFDHVQFHALGLNARPKRWLPEPSDRLLVISPFVRADALQALASTTGDAVAIVSRGEELDRIAADTLALFGKIYVLDDRAETEDGEDLEAEAQGRCLRGLHAKVYVAKRGWDTHIYLGSANASNAALLSGRNIELLAELVGKTSKVPGKGIDGVLEEESLGALLVEYHPSALVEVDSAAELAERALREAAIELASAGLILLFERTADGHRPVLIVKEPLVLNDVADARAWLVTTDPSTASDVLAVRQAGRVPLATCATASVTGLVAFELAAASADRRSSFSLNLAVEGMPSDRDAQIIRVIVNNSDRFLAYLLALLEGFDPDVLAGISESDLTKACNGRAFAATQGLLERLVRARARDPQRLDELREIVHALLSTPDGKAILPADFAEVWDAIAPEARP